MSHELSMRACDIWEDENASVTCVFPVSGKQGLAPASHSPNNSDDSAFTPLVTPHREPGGFLVPVLYVGPFVQNFLHMFNYRHVG